VLRESKDKLLVMQFDLAVMLRQPRTSSRRDLVEILPLVDPPTKKDLGSYCWSKAAARWDSCRKAWRHAHLTTLGPAFDLPDH
jgi:hypothetical protein